MDRAAVKFSLPFGELFVQIPGSGPAMSVEPVIGEHVIVELRTCRGELISVAAYRDVQALMGREGPIVWALDANGAPVRVTEHAQLPPVDPWWDGLVERLLTRAPGSNGEVG